MPLPHPAPGKIRLPPLRPGSVDRPRLRALLDPLDTPGGPRVALVSAAAGSGKSILALEWLHARTGPVAWLALDEEDREPRRFHAALASALRAAEHPALEAAAAAAARLARHGGEAGPDLRSALAACPDDVVLALDDLHLLHDAPPAREVAQWVRDGIPGLRLLLLTRIDPPVPLGRLRVSGHLIEIRGRDLRFDVGEAGELLDEALGRPLAGGLVARLEARTEGWAAGLRMAAAVLDRTDDDEAAVEAFGGSHRLMADYLVEEALGRLDPGLRTTLLETSVLPRFTPSACARITGRPDAALHVRSAWEANLFVLSLDDAGVWFRYHHLFAELLRHRLVQEAPERHDALRLAASRWYEERGDEQAALAQAAAVSAPGRLLDLLDRHGYPILARSEFASYARWAAHAPDVLSAAARRRPMFLVAEAWFRAQTRRAAEVEPILQAIAEGVAHPPAGYPAERMRDVAHHLGALRAFTLRMADRLDEALEVGDEVLATLPDSARAMRGVVAFNSGATRLRLLDMDGARRDLEGSYGDCLAAGIHYLVLASLGHLGNLIAHTEGLPSARRHLAGAVTFAEAEGLAGIPAFAIVLYQLANVHLLAHEPVEARAALERALELVRGERDTDIQANVLLHLARLEALDGRPGQARAHLASAAGLAHGHMVKPFATTLEVEGARLAALYGDRAIDPPALSGRVGPDEAWTSPREAEVVLAVQHGVRRGNTDVGALIARLEEESARRNRGVAQLVARLARACRTDPPEERRALAARALEAARRRGYVAPVVDGGAPVEGLVADVLRRGGSADLAGWLRARILPAFDLARGRSGASAPPDPVPASGADTELTERELEVLAEVARGRTNAEVAEALFVSLNTVKTHLKHAYAKLDVSNRTAAVRAARRDGLLAAPGGEGGSDRSGTPADRPRG